MNENEISKLLVDIFYQVHIKLGPGLLESVYEEIICYKLHQKEIPFKRQQGIRVEFEGVVLDMGFRSDIIVDDKVIVEIKSIEAISPVHFKQVITYLRITGIKLGLLVNFNVPLIKDGIHRVVNRL